VVALPVGSLEQHGDHLPTDTDAFLATSVVEEAAVRARSPVVVLPCLPFGISRYHERFGGTIWLSGSTFISVFREICASARAAGAQSILAINGHGGNAGALETVSLEISDRTFSVIPVSYWDLAPEVAREVFESDRGAIGHAGQAETSLLLALRADLVGDVSGLHESVDVELARERASIDGLGETGVVGNPAVAEAELGARFFDAVCSELAFVFDAASERTSMREAAT
jgi:creatinine amidohydrolase